MKRLLNYYFVALLLSLPLVSKSIIINDQSNESEAYQLAIQNNGHKFIGRVCFKGNSEPSTSSAAIVSSNRAILFTKQPKNINTIEMLTISGKRENGFVSLEEKNIYKVNKILELFRNEFGSLVCCEIEGNFTDFIPICFPMLGLNNPEAAQIPWYNFHKTHTVQGQTCTRAYIFGYGQNIDFTTRLSLSDPYNLQISRELKACTACVNEAYTGSDRLTCPFELLEINIPYKQPYIVDGYYYGDYVYYHKKYHLRKFGLVGQDDLGAFLIQFDSNKRPILIGLADDLSGSTDISDPKKPFYPRKSIFLRISKLSCLDKLHQITSLNMMPGFTNIEGHTFPTNNESIEITSNYKRLANGITVGKIDILKGKGCPAIKIDNRGIGRESVLIDTYYVLTTESHNLIQEGFSIGGRTFYAEKLFDIQYNDLHYKLVKLVEPVTELTPLQRARSDNILNSGKAIRSEKVNLMELKKGFIIGQSYSFLNFANEQGDLLLNQKIQNTIDNLILEESLRIK